MAPSSSGGAKDLSAEDILRRHLPPVYTGKGWSAIIGGIAAGDEQIRADTRAAFDQIFTATASGKFLDRRGSNAGIERPADVGMQDDDYRTLITLLETTQVTEQAVWDLLAIFYGAAAVAAHVDSSGTDPFALQDGWTLVFTDGAKTCTTVFSTADFADIAHAKAAEVCASINAATVAQGVQAYAIPQVIAATGTTVVRILARQRGIRSKLSVLGGFAQKVFGFPTQIAAGSVANGTWTVSLPRYGVTRYKQAATAAPEFADLRAGDYAIVSGGTFSAANRGTFPVIATSTLWNGATYDQFFEVENVGVAQAGLVLSAGDVTVWRPTVATVATQASPVTLVETGTGWKLRLPATSPVVVRGPGTGAYLQPRHTLPFTSIVQAATGEALVTGASSHGLVPGQNVLLDTPAPTLQIPAVVAGTNGVLGGPGTTTVSQMTEQVDIRSDVSPARVDAVATGLASGNVLVTGGQNTTASPAPTLADTYLFQTTSQAVLSSGNGRGRTQYTYNWASAAALPAPSCLHTLTGLVGLLAGKAVLIGGAVQSGGVLVARVANKGLVYDEDADTWTAVVGTPASRWGHTATLLSTSTGDDVVYLAGGQTDGATATGVLETFRSTAGGTVATVLTEAAGRCRHAATALTATKLLVAGGSTTPSGVARADCLVYDEIAAGTVAVGKMGLTRKDHLLVQISDGQVLAIGGQGRDPTNEDSDRLLSECEIFDIATKRWRPTGKMRMGLSNPTAYVSGGKVYLTGGSTLAGTSVTGVGEYYDITTGLWRSRGVISPRNRAAVGNTVYGQLRVGGTTDIVPTGTVTASLTIPGADVATRRSAAGGVRTVAAVPTSTTWTFQDQAGEIATYGATATAEPFTAQPAVFPGPYVFDPHAGLPVTGTSTTTTVALRRGGRYASLAVANAAAFPDSGWVVFAFGTAEQIGPVRYLSKQSSTLLLLDATYAFPAAVAKGATVGLLAGRIGFVPPVDNLGDLYATDSAAGREVAIDAVLRATAAGLPYEIEVVYPSDVGLGGEGSPAEVG